MALNSIKAILTCPWCWFLAKSTNGMLSPFVYREIYNQTIKLPDLPFVEVGAALGTGTIALARAYKDSGKSSKIISVEKCVGGSRSEYSSEQNLRLLERNLDRFNVRDRVSLYTKKLELESGDEIWNLIDSPQIAGFLLDADGRLDRDFKLFWPRTVPEGLIVVDDYKEDYKFKVKSHRQPLGATKCLRTYKMLNVLRDEGLFHPSQQVEGTMFGTKPKEIKNAKSLPEDRLSYVESDIDREYNKFLKNLNR